MRPSLDDERRPARWFTALVLATSLAPGAVHGRSGRPQQSRPQQSSTGATLVRYEFTRSAEDWLISTDTGIADPIFQPTGGNPGACIAGVDQALGETWYFRAPTTVLQQLLAAENGALSFSLKQSSDIDGGFLDDDVVIIGTAGRIGYRFGWGSAPGTQWRDFSVRLSAGNGWTWNWSMPATQAQIRSVLAAPLSLEIRGEHVTGDDEASLDNVLLKAAPATSF